MLLALELWISHGEKGTCPSNLESGKQGEGGYVDSKGMHGC